MNSIANNSIKVFAIFGIAFVVYRALNIQMVSLLFPIDALFPVLLLAFCFTTISYGPTVLFQSVYKSLQFFFASNAELGQEHTSCIGSFCRFFYAASGTWVGYYLVFEMEKEAFNIQEIISSIVVVMMYPYLVKNFYHNVIIDKLQRKGKNI